jgi:hypothetical protein
MCIKIRNVNDIDPLPIGNLHLYHSNNRDNGINKEYFETKVGTLRLNDQIKKGLVMHVIDNR